MIVTVHFSKSIWNWKDFHGFIDELQDQRGNPLTDSRIVYIDPSPERFFEVGFSQPDF